MKEETLSWKAEVFFAKNWKYLFWGIIAAILIVMWEVHSINNRMESLEKTVAENNNKVVLTTTDGRAIKVLKTPIKAEYLKQYIMSTFVNNFIVSRAQLTDNFQRNVFKKYSDILESSKPLAMIYNEYLDKDNKQALGDFASYLQWLLSAIGQDKLPEYIAIRDYSISSYEYLENTFKVVLDVKVTAQSYILAQNQYLTQEGTIKISASGTFSLELSSDNNPYGMRISRFGINMITKGK
jgi:hypothetical protein